MNKSIPLATVVALGLAGCGSDSDPKSAIPVEPSPAPVYENLDISVTPNQALSGKINIYLGRWYPCTQEHRPLHQVCNAEGLAANIEDLPTTGAINGTYGKNVKDGVLLDDRNNYHKNYNAFTRDDSKYVMQIDVADLKAFRNQSVRNDVFVEGHYSILDVMLYVASVRDDFDVTLGEFDSSRNSYNYTVSFDANGNGDFTDEPAIDGSGDWGDYHHSNHWSAAFLYNGGDFGKAKGIPQFETLYDRLDEFFVQSEMHIRLMPISTELRNRIDEMQQRETQRLKDNGGQVILPFLRANFGDGQGYQVLAEDMVVRPFNLRPDIFRKDVITMADAIMTAYVDYGVNIRMNYWPTMSTNAEVGSFAITQIGSQRAHGLYGWNYHSGELHSEYDFKNGAEWPNVADLQASTGQYSAMCSFLRDDSGQINNADAQTCIDTWFGLFGGNNVHRMTDKGVMLNPKEHISFGWNNKMYTNWQPTQRNNVQDPVGENDGKYNIFDISQAVAPLDSSHFGWGIADCSQCHGINNIHLGMGDSPEIPDTVEPYYCAQCHAGNGAPQGHGETARCFWCHSNDKLMANHGDASILKSFADVDCTGSTNGQLSGEIIYLNDQDGSITSSCVDAIKAIDINHQELHDLIDNGTTYATRMEGRQLTVGNSDWETSKVFPDPYSCLTCHPNQ